MGVGWSVGRLLQNGVFEPNASGRTRGNGRVTANADVGRQKSLVRAAVRGNEIHASSHQDVVFMMFVYVHG